MDPLSNSAKELLDNHQLYHQANHVGCDFCLQMFDIFPFYSYDSFYYDFEKKINKPYKSYRFQHKYNLIQVPKDEQVRCDECDILFTTASNKYRHVKTQHLEKSYPCEDCDEKFCSMHLFKQHIKKFHLECNNCHEKFSRKTYLVAHMSRVKVVCAICSLTFCNQRQLILHKASSHRNVKNFQCDQCGDKFAKNWLLARLTRNSTKFECEACILYFCNSQSLISHNYRQHKCIKCDMCGKVYPEVNITLHMFGHHLDKPVPHPSNRQDLQAQLIIFKPDEEDNFTLAFTNHLGFKFPSILCHFSQYSEVNPPVVSRGPAEGKVLISFKSKVEATVALTKNFDSTDYSWLQITPACRKVVM
jgi:hypothetical protein